MKTIKETYIAPTLEVEQVELEQVISNSEVNFDDEGSSGESRAPEYRRGWGSWNSDEE